MGFRAGSYARIWSVDDKGNYSVAKMSISKKNKETNNYEVEFQEGFVRLVGSAHTFMQSINVPDKGYPVKISSCDVTNKYDSEKKRTYYNFVIFGLEDANGNSPAPSKDITIGATYNKPSKSNSDFTVIDDDDGELPF